MLILSGLVLRVTLEAVLNGESVTRNTKLFWKMYWEAWLREYIDRADNVLAQEHFSVGT